MLYLVWGCLTRGLGWVGYGVRVSGDDAARAADLYWQDAPDGAAALASVAPPLAALPLASETRPRGGPALNQPRHLNANREVLGQRSESIITWGGSMCTWAFLRFCV